MALTLKQLNPIQKKRGHKVFFKEPLLFKNISYNKYYQKSLIFRGITIVLFFEIFKARKKLALLDLKCMWPYIAKVKSKKYFNKSTNLPKDIPYFDFIFFKDHLKCQIIILWRICNNSILRNKLCVLSLFLYLHFWCVARFGAIYTTLIKVTHLRGCFSRFKIVQMAPNCAKYLICFRSDKHVPFHTF